MSSSNPSPTSEDIARLQAQIEDLKKQIAELKQGQLGTDPNFNIEVPIFNGLGRSDVTLAEWEWNMKAKLATPEAQLLDEKTKINYIASRIQGEAFQRILRFLPGQGDPEEVETADGFMYLCSQRLGF